MFLECAKNVGKSLGHAMIWGTKVFRREFVEELIAHGQVFSVWSVW